MCVCLCVTADEEIDIHNALVDTMSLNDGSTFLRMTTMIPILRDFKPIVDLDLYSEHMPEERITG